MQVAWACGALQAQDLSNTSHRVNNMVHKKQACTAVHYQVTQNDLPLSCPLPNMRLWDAHPRVYLPIDELGEVTCPYCSTDYYLKD